MTSLDILMILIGIGLIVFGTFQRTLRMLMLVFSFYIICLAVGAITLASDVLYDLGNALMEVIGGRTPNVLIIQSVVFLGLLIPGFGLAYLITHAAFHDTTFPKLGALDYILGAVIGTVLALLFTAVLLNTWGVMVSVRWRPRTTWYMMRAAYARSLLRPTLHRVLLTYRRFLLPLRLLREYPPFFTPQR